MESANPQMTPLQALSVLDQVAARASVSRALHVQVQEAVNIIRAALQPKKEPKQEAPAKVLDMPAPKAEPVKGV